MEYKLDFYDCDADSYDAARDMGISFLWKKRSMAILDEGQAIILKLKFPKLVLIPLKQGEVLR